MRIRNIEKKIFDGKVRVSAQVFWEKSRRSEEVYFEVDKTFDDDIQPNPDAFLVGCFLPAMFSGEERINIEGKVCPILVDGINLNIRCFQHWYGEGLFFKVDCDTKVIESSRNTLIAGTGGGRKALFLSGGLDSLFSLRKNRLNSLTGDSNFIQDN